MSLTLQLLKERCRAARRLEDLRARERSSSIVETIGDGETANTNLVVVVLRRGDRDARTASGLSASMPNSDAKTHTVKRNTAAAYSETTDLDSLQRIGLRRFSVVKPCVC